jgi:pyridoxamine 5'-phosphate oxidase
MLTPAQLAALRQDYSQRGLRRAELDPDPIAQFNHWLADALQQEIPEPNAMVLSTVDPNGQPWSRTVLLKICDARGFAFFTNYESAKGRQLAANPRAALTFLWVPLERQVNIAGTITRTSREQSERYFQSRPANSQLGAWASAQSSLIPDRVELERQFDEARAKFGEAAISLPPHWGGYTLTPHTIEFWQGRRSRLHDRLRYSKQPEGDWKIERLAP